MGMGSGLWAAAGVVFIFMCYIAEAYQNLTVGGAAGWSYDDQSNSTAADYSKWAKNQTFSLGDYLIFNTNYNHSVVRTYNASTYDSCNYDDTETNDDTSMYLEEDLNKPNTNATVSIPLTVPGMNYFYSSADDGIECLAGLRFEANVSVGEGLPPSLRHPPPPPFSGPPLSVFPLLSPPPSVKSSGSQTIKATTFSAFGLFLSIVFGFI
ncbi:early nodulin-like protein 18 [Cryptomeria japonica]|uniref:early nodulin-like protein 18 n=1 Tax=Cryptomeria japonica TaxID=3369 RepID=UPI0027DA3FBE|nr:early nodulin-like protein 18 [Cryptomeria japonica]